MDLGFMLAGFAVVVAWLVVIQKDQANITAGINEIIDRQEVIFDFIDDLEAVPDDDEEGEPWK